MNFQIKKRGFNNNSNNNNNNKKMTKTIIVVILNTNKIVIIIIVVNITIILFVADYMPVTESCLYGSCRNLHWIIIINIDYMSPENHLPPHRPSCHSELCCWDPEATCSLEMRTAPSEEEPKKNWVLVWCAPLLLILLVKKQDSRQTVSIIHVIKVYNSRNGIATPFHN